MQMTRWLLVGVLVFAVATALYQVPHLYATNVWENAELWGGDRSVLIVAGGWRSQHHNKSWGTRGRLTLCFMNRLTMGAFVALRTNISDIVLTGGRWDSHDSRRWLIETYGVDVPADWNMTADIVQVSLRIPIADVEGPVLKGLPGDQIALTGAVRLWIENSSTITAENAIGAKALLERHEFEPRRVVVVSSLYHIPRCLVYFAKAFSGTPTAVVPTTKNEFDLTLPKYFWMPNEPVRTNMNIWGAWLRSIPVKTYPYMAMREAMAFIDNLFWKRVMSTADLAVLL